MGIEFQGFDELEKKLAEAEKKLPGARELFLRQEAELVRSDVVKLTPVDTGRLREGWKVSPLKAGTVDIYNNTDYALILWRM